MTADKAAEGAPRGYLLARAQTGWPRPAAARPLAGSAHVWWADALRLSRDGPSKLVDPDTPLSDLLSAPRPILPGLPTDRPLVMGIVNVTPDSFSDGGEAYGVAAALARARAIVDDGADILDIGGESTRPGADEVPVAEEIARIRPVIAAIRDAGIAAPISIDTRKAAVAAAALAAGAEMVNDVSALGFDPELAPLVADADVPLCLMHAQGAPKTMQDDPRYGDVLLDVFDALAARMDAAQAQGIARTRLIVDPGIGFGKTQAHNLALLRGLALFHALGAPVLLGASRKRFIGAIGAAGEGAARMPGSVAVALHAAAQGAQILRVHDVGATVQALRLWQALSGAQDG